MMSASDLMGKVVVITGATSGFGEASAIEFAKHGSKLVLCGRNLEGLQDSKEKCIKQGLDSKHVAVVTGDLRDDTTHDCIVSTALNSFGKVDILFLNAGKCHPVNGPVTSDESVESLDYYYQMYIKSAYKLTNKLSTELIKSKGAIVFTSSITSSARLLDPWQSGGSLMRSALDQMIRLFALTFANKGVRVNGIRPGYVETNVTSEAVVDVDKALQSFGAVTPLGGCVAIAEEVARVVVFLASNQSACMTGTLLDVDKGASMVHPSVDWKQF